MVARRAVDGVIEATKEIGGNVEEVAKAAIGGAFEAAGAISNIALRAVKEMLGGVLEGVKEVAGDALPKVTVRPASPRGSAPSGVPAAAPPEKRPARAKGKEE
jgi:hypothetical protein